MSRQREEATPRCPLAKRESIASGLGQAAFASFGRATHADSKHMSKTEEKTMSMYSHGQRPRISTACTADTSASQLICASQLRVLADSCTVAYRASEDDSGEF